MAKAKLLKIACQTAISEPLKELKPFQRKFKIIKDSERAKLKAQLLGLGVCEPFIIWLDGEGKKRILDGHQRHEVLCEMVKEGEIEIPDAGLPVVYAYPKNEDEAIRMVLALASVYGRVNKSGLKKFREAFGVTEKEFQASFSFPELETSDPEEADKAGFGEGDEDKIEPKKKMVKCPGCGKVFVAKENKAKKGKKAKAGADAE